MEILAYLAVLRRHLKVLILLPIIAGVVAVLATYAVSPKYVGTSRVQVLVEQLEPGTLKLRSENGLGELTVNVRDVSEVINEQIVAMLGRREAAAEIVRRLRLDEKDPNADLMSRVREELSRLKQIVWDIVRYGEHKEKPAFEAAVDKVQASISAMPETGSFIIEVTAKAKAPELAAAIANAAVDVLVEDSGQMAKDLSRMKREFLEQQLAEAEQRSQAAQRALADYRADNGIVALAEQARLGVQAAEQIRASIREIDVDVARSQALLTELTSQTGETPPDILSTQTASSVTTQGMTTYSSSEETSASRSTDTSGSGTSQMDSESSSSSEFVSPNPILQGLQTLVLDTQRSIPALQARRAELMDEAAAQEAANREWITIDFEVGQLSVQASLADEQYRAIADDLHSARVEEARPTSPVRILDRAVAPLYPASPVKGLYAAAAAVLGLLVAVVLVFLLDYCDLSVKSVREVEEALGIGSLGVVPSPARTRLSSYRNRGRGGKNDSFDIAT